MHEKLKNKTKNVSSGNICSNRPIATLHAYKNGIRLSQNVEHQPQARSAHVNQP